MQLLELACSSLTLHSVQWVYMKFHELACSFMRMYAVPIFVWEAHKNFAVLVIRTYDFMIFRLDVYTFRVVVAEYLRSVWSSKEVPKVLIPLGSVQCWFIFGIQAQNWCVSQGSLVWCKIIRNWQATSIYLQSNLRNMTHEYFLTTNRDSNSVITQKLIKVSLYVRASALWYKCDQITLPVLFEGF